MAGEESGDKKFNIDRITESIERTETMAFLKSKIGMLVS
jgi:hypothetical protein